MLAEANRLHVPVAVPNESILEMGATISFSAVAADIAAAIVNVVGLIGAGEIDQVPPISELSEIRVVTNEIQMRRSIKADAAAVNDETRSTLQ